MPDLFPPFSSPMVDRAELKITRIWRLYLQGLTAQAGSAGGGGAPAGAEYVVGSLTGLLPNARLAIDSPTITVDLLTPGEIQWHLVPTALPVIQGDPVVLDNAAILALPTTTFVELVAAPGVGLRIVPAYVDVKLVIAGPYGNVDPDGYWVGNLDGEQTVTNYLGNDSTIPLTLLTDTLGTIATWVLTLVPYTLSEPVNQWGNMPFPFSMTGGGGLNAAFGLFVENQGAGDYTGGDAGNSLTMTPFYSLVGY